MILVVVEHEAGAPDRLSLEALTLGRAPGRGDRRAAPRGRLGPGRGRRWPARSAATGVAVLHVIEDPRLTDYAPEAIGKSRRPARRARRARRGHRRRAATAARRSWPTSRRGPACRWPPTAPRSGPATRGRSPASAGAAACSRRPARRPDPAPDGRAARASSRPPAAAADAGRRRAVRPGARPTRDLRVRVTSRVAGRGRQDLAGRRAGRRRWRTRRRQRRGLRRARRARRRCSAATVGVSRVVTSAGWRPHAQQVGQTGTRIAPDLYIACGISGAIQHIVGCRLGQGDPGHQHGPRRADGDPGDLRGHRRPARVLPAIIAEVRGRALGAAGRSAVGGRVRRRAPPPSPSTPRPSPRGSPVTAVPTVGKIRSSGTRSSAP